MDTDISAGLNPAAPASARTDWIVTLAWVVPFLILLPMAWGRTGDVVVDSFHDLTVAMRLQQGEILYRDIAYLYGPVGAFAVWLWSAIAGFSVGSYLLLCAVMALLELHLADRLARPFLAPVGRMFLLLGILGTFTFHSELFGRLMPYSLSAFLAELLFLFFLERLVASRQAGTGHGAPLAAGLAAGILLHTKLEFGLVASGAMVLDFLVERMVPSGDRLLRHRTNMWIGWLMGIAGGFLLVHALGSDVHSYVSNINPFPFLTSAAGRNLAVFAGGITSGSRMLDVAAFAVLTASVMLVPAGVLWCFVQRSVRTVVLLLGAVVIVTVWRSRLPVVLGYTVLTGATVFLLLAVAALVPDVRKNAASRTRLLVVLPAAALLARSPAALAPGLFGSFYLLPALVIGVMLSGEWGRWLGFFWPRRSAQAVAAGFCLYAAWGFGENLSRFKVKTYAVAPGLLPFMTDGNRARVVGGAIDYLARRVKPGDMLAVVPQEPVFYFALQAMPVFPDHNFIAHVVRGEPMQELADRLRAVGPRYAVVSNRPYREGGLGEFGNSYAFEIQAVLDSHYHLAAVFGREKLPAGAVVTGALGDPYYSVRIYERNPD